VPTDRRADRHTSGGGCQVSAKAPARDCRARRGDGWPSVHGGTVYRHQRMGSRPGCESRTQTRARVPEAGRSAAIVISWFPIPDRCGSISHR